MIAVRETRGTRELRDAGSVARDRISLRTDTVRRAELDQLRDVLDEVTSGRQTVVELAGDPGSGKSRLLTALAEDASARGFTVLRALADPAEQDLAGALFVQILRDWIGLADLAGLRDELLALLRRISVSVEASTDGCPNPERLRALLEQHTCRGLLIVLDDVHAADPGSLALLDRLIRWPVRAPLALVVSHRPRQTPQTLRATLARGSQLGTTRRIELGRLGLAQAAELLDLPATTPRLRALHRDSHGNPLYLLALAGVCPGRLSGRPEGSLADLRGLPPDAALPDRLARHLVTELAVLGPEQRLVLDAASVLGTELDARAVAAVAGTSEDEACRTIDDLRRLDLLRPLAGGPRSTFRHPLVRWLVHDGTDFCWRSDAHRRAVGVLAGRGAPAERLAPHIERATPGRDPQDAAVLAEAARSALRSGDTDLAGHWLGTALTALGHQDPADDRVAGQLLAAAGEVAARTGSRGLLAEATARLGRGSRADASGPGRPQAEERPGRRGAAPSRRPASARPPRSALPAATAEPAGPSFELLTEREREIAELAGTGLRSREIADRLGLSARTVEVHIARTYRKLGIGSRAALVRMVVEEHRRAS
ncbi:AAA family ATPase [Kitasatospora sp. NPDC059463]|uniref:helix-turn-helix transcriptional regulator n=1 Tax=unclassified Kitasatospora TaxID=2633591 RepID=UPI00369CAFA4